MDFQEIVHDKERFKIDYQNVVLGQMKEELASLVDVVERNSDWLNVDETGTESKLGVGQSQRQNVLKMLTDIAQLQLDPWEPLTESNFQISELRMENKVHLMKLRKSELNHQIEYLQQHIQRVRNVRDSVQASFEISKALLEKRKNVLRRCLESKNGLGHGDDGFDQDQVALQSYLQNKYAPPVTFDEEKFVRVLDRLKLLQEQQKEQSKRCATENSCPMVRIPPNLYVAQEEYNERQIHLNKLKEKIENLTNPS